MSQCRALAAILVFSLLTVSASATLEELTAALVKLNLSASATVSALSTHARPHVHVGLSRARMARQFVNAHNLVRAAFGLQPLRWNKTLARYARRWADERAGDCALLHSPNRPYGENLFWSLKGNWGPREVVKVWADEYRFFDPKQNECINGEMCGHYTQIIWQNTQQLGCGRVECHGGRGFLYVCSYNPPGNIYYRGPFGGQFSKSIVKPTP